MRIVGIGMQEADADRANAVLAEVARRLAHARLVERTQFVAAEIEPAAGLAHMLQRHEAVGLHPEIGIAVSLGHRLPRDLENVPEARVDQQPERGDLALQQRVGRDRGAVGEADHAVGACASGRQNPGDALHQADRRIGGRARHLGDGGGPGDDVDRNDIGECSAGIDTDAEARRRRGAGHGRAATRLRNAPQDGLPQPPKSKTDC